MTVEGARLVLGVDMGFLGSLRSDGNWSGTVGARQPSLLVGYVLLKW